MNDFLETAGSLSIVLAVNLILLGAILAGGLALFFRFTESVSPRLRYAIACAVFLLAIVLPFGLSFKTPLRQQGTQKPATVEIENVGETESAGIQNNFSIPQSAYIQAETSQNSAAGNNDNVLDKFILFAADSPFGIVFLGLWLAGIVFLFYREAAGFWQMRRARKSWTPATNDEREFFICPENVSLYFDEQQSPGTVGLLRPTIVLPRNFPAEISLESKHFIVRHELAHAKWRDPLGKFLLKVIKNLFWISPALWMIESLADAEREAAADRAAITSLAGEAESETDALSYAETLLTVAKAFSSHRQKSWKQAVGVSGAGSELEIRVCRLLSSSQTTRAHLFSAIAACLLTGTLMSIIPLAAFSEIAKKSSTELNAAATDGENASDEKDINDASLAGSPAPTPRPASARNENRRDNKSDSSSKPASLEKPSSSEKASINSPQSDAQKAAENETEASGDSAASARKISEEDAKAAELRKLRPFDSRSAQLGPLPAKGKSNFEPMTPLGGLKNSSPETEEPARQKALSEADSYRARAADRTMPPELPKRTDYKSRYIPYPASRSPQ